MKRFIFIFLALLLLLTACAPGRNAGNCSDGVCFKLRSTGPIKKDQSIPVEIIIKVDRDVPEVITSMDVDPGIIIEEVKDKSNMTHKGKFNVVWKKEMKAGEEYTIVQNVHFESTGVGNVTIVVSIRPNVVITEAIVFVISEEGGTAYLPGTPMPPMSPEVILPDPMLTLSPIDTILPSPTPLATKLPPVSTEAPLPTPTEPAYPYP